MYVCVYTFILQVQAYHGYDVNICMYMCVYICTYVYKYIYVGVHTYIAYPGLSCVRYNTYIYMCVHVYTYIYIYIYICVRVNINIYCISMLIMGTI